MTTSYSKNIHFSNLFVYYSLDSQVLLSSCISIKTGLFFFLTFCCIIIPISGILDLYCIMKKLKISGENKNESKTIYPKNHDNFKNSKPRVLYCNKKECICSLRCFSSKKSKGFFYRSSHRRYSVKKGVLKNFLPEGLQLY